MDQRLATIIDLIASGMTLEQAEKQVENDYDRQPTHDNLPASRHLSGGERKRNYRLNKRRHKHE